MENRKPISVVMYYDNNCKETASAECYDKQPDPAWPARTMKTAFKEAALVTIQHLPKKTNDLIIVKNVVKGRKLPTDVLSKFKKLGVEVK